jgi:hypothetical protein
VTLQSCLLLLLAGSGLAAQQDSLDRKIAVHALGFARQLEAQLRYSPWPPLLGGPIGLPSGLVNFALVIP